MNLRIKFILTLIEYSFKFEFINMIYNIKNHNFSFKSQFVLKKSEKTQN